MDHTNSHGGMGVKGITLAGGPLPEPNPARTLEAAL